MAEVDCGLYVKKQTANENQVIFRHATASHWFQQVQQQAEGHCAQYGKKAIMKSSDCDLVNPYYGYKECLTIYDCQ